MREELIKLKKVSKCFNITAGQIDSLRSNTETTTTVRVYENDRIGVAGKIGSCDIEELRKEAIENLKLGIPYPDIKEEALERSVDAYKEIIPAKQLVPSMKKLMNRICEENPQFVFGNKIILNEVEKSYVSENRKLDYKGSSLAFSITIKYKGAANVFDEAFGAEVTEYNEDDIANGIKLVCGSFLNKLPMIEEDEAVFVTDLSAIGGILGHFTADYYYNNLSLFSGKLGEKIFSDKLNVVIDRSPKTALCVPFFDAEGYVSQNDTVSLIENGTFKKVLACKKHSMQYGCEYGGMSGSDYNSVPSISGAGFTVVPTAENLSDIVGDGRAVFVTMSGGGDVTADGTQSTPVQASYLMENGKIVGRLGDYAITGNVKELFGENFIGVAKNGLYKGAGPYLVFKAKLVNKEA